MQLCCWVNSRVGVECCVIWCVGCKLRSETTNQGYDAEIKYRCPMWTNCCWCGSSSRNSCRKSKPLDVHWLFQEVAGSLPYGKSRNSEGYRSIGSTLSESIWSSIWVNMIRIGTLRSTYSRRYENYLEREDPNDCIASAFWWNGGTLQQDCGSIFAEGSVTQPTRLDAATPTDTSARCSFFIGRLGRVRRKFCME